MISQPGSVASQIRKTALRVNAGGASGRSAVVHNGVGLRDGSGGQNVRGSGVGIGAVGRGVLPPTQADPYRSILRNGRRVLVRQSQMTPSEKLSWTNRGQRPAASAKPVQNPAVQQATPVAQQDALPGPLDYRHQADYISGMASIGLNYGLQRSGIQDQLLENARQFATQTGDVKRSAERDFRASRDNYSHAGLLRSGAREVGDADMAREYDRALADLDTHFGSGASSKLNAALQQLASQEAIDRQQVEQSAADSYNQAYEALPIAEQPQPQPQPAVSQPSAKKPAQAASKWLRVRVSNGRGGWDVKVMDRAKMTPAQLKAALASGLNR